MAAGLSAVLTTLVFVGAEEPQPRQEKGPPFAISKETTQITEPLDAQGWPDYITYVDRQLSAGVTPENNSLVAILRIIGMQEIAADLRPQAFRKLGIEPFAKDAKHRMSLGDYLRSLQPAPEVNAFWEEQTRALAGPWRDEEAPHMAKWLDANAAQLEGLKAAIERPRYYAPLLVGKAQEEQMMLAILLPFANQHRDVANTLAMRAYRNLGRGDVEKALADSLLLHRLARHLASQACLIDYLVGDTVDSIANNLDAAIAHHGKLSAAKAKAIAAELTRLPPFPSPIEKLTTERLSTLDTLQAVSRFGAGQLSSVFDIAGGKQDPLMQELARNVVDWNAAMKLVNSDYERMVVAAKIPDWKKRRAAWEQAEKERQEAGTREERDAVDFLAAALDGKVRARKLGRSIGRKVLDLLVIDGPAILRCEEKSTTRRELVQIAFALAGYRADEGKYPANLSALVPKYLAKLPQDYYSGNDYIFRPTAAGYVLYGVGQDGRDDGAKEEDMADFVLTVD